MAVYLAPQYVALLFILIILLYSREHNFIPTLKNRIFRICLLTTFYIILISIINLHLQGFNTYIPSLVISVLKLFLYLFVPLTSLLFLYYMIAVIWEEDPKATFFMKVASLPYALYALATLTTPFSGLMFDFENPLAEPSRVALTSGFSTALFYVLTMFLIVLVNRQKIELTQRWILLVYPALTIILPVLQLVTGMLPAGIGSAATLLIIYLYIQNKRIFVDNLTGLQNRLAFLQVLELKLKKKAKMDIILISMDDFKVINDRFGQTTGDSFLKAISQYFTSVISITSTATPAMNLASFWRTTTLKQSIISSRKLELALLNNGTSNSYPPASPSASRW